MPETGEEIVGAWLRYMASCEFVEYGVQIPGAGEIDVVGLSLRHNRAYVCEVATHIHGLQYKDNRGTIEKKFLRAKEYADDALRSVNVSYEFWSPVVRTGLQLDAVKQVQSALRDGPGIELAAIINASYRDRLKELRQVASELTRNASHPVLRLLQIEEWSSKYVQSP